MAGILSFSSTARQCFPPKPPILNIYARQAALWCLACGRQGKLKKGLSSPCYAREIRDQRYFGGLRLRVIARDRGACRVCGRPGRGNRIHVHHRRPGVSNSNSKARFLITLCPGHHTLVHRLKVFDRILPPFLLDLWREQHPGAWEQLALDFNRASDFEQVYLRQWEIRA